MAEQEQVLPKGAGDFVKPTEDEIAADSVITEADIADAAAWWRETQPEETRGLLDATAKGSD